jgi:hypothetical protein
VGGFAEASAQDRGIGSGGFPATATADGGAFACDFVFLAAADRGGEGTPARWEHIQGVQQTPKRVFRVASAQAAETSMLVGAEPPAPRLSEVGCQL